MEKTINESEVVEHLDHLPRIRNIRPAWQEFLLFLFTGTLYSSFWLVGRARDIKNASENQMVPWLWFCVPLISIVQPFAFSKIFKELRTLEIKNKKNDNPWVWSGYIWVWIALMFASSVILSFYDTYGFSTWLMSISFVLTAVLYTVLHSRFNQWKSQIPNAVFHGKSYGYHWYEWCGLIVIGSLMLYGLYAFVLAPMMVAKIRDYNNEQVVENHDLGFVFTIYGNDWSEVETGSFTDDDSVMEVNGPLYDNYFIVFDQGISSSLNSTAEGRYLARYEFTGTPSCEEERFMSTNQASVVSYTECNGSMLGDSVTTFSTLIESGDRIIELYGHVSGALVSHEKVSQDMRKIAKGFTPL